MGMQQIRRFVGSRMITAIAIVLLVCLPSIAAETFLAGFDGDFSTTTGTDFTSDGLTTQTFVTGNGVTQGTHALAIEQPRSPPQLVDMKLITLDNVPLVASHDRIRMDVTVPENVGARSVWLSFRADDLFANSPELSFVAELPARSGTVDWNYAAEGIKDFAANYSGSFWTIAIGVRGNDFNGGLPITTIVDNIRFVPEPTSAGLIAISALVMIGLRRRRENKAKRISALSGRIPSSG